MSGNFVHVTEWPGYSVNRLGQVRGPSGKILRPRTVRGGYLTVMAYDGTGAARQVYIHHLVLTAFVGSRPEGQEACHGDGGPGDNRLENLRWDTRDANIQDRIDSRPRCKNGHQWTGWRKNGSGRTRYCNSCRRDAYRAKVTR
jgi:hypothetical protein